MRMTSIEQKGFLPYTHTGTKFLHIDFMDKVTAIMASNGFGKSSLLREISPYPPVRTDYMKQGYVKKTFKHGAHVYDLVSDFKNSTSPHSFKEDGVELNISGTTDTQKDLIEEKFGMTPIIEDLMSGKFKICDMRPSERKTLFSCMYPSDLTFVLEYHKQICSQIRTFNNQIKLLKTRDASLRGKLMDKAQMVELNKTREEYNAIINLIDKLNLLLESENSRLQVMPEYAHPAAGSTSLAIMMDGFLSSDRDTIDRIKDMLEYWKEQYNLIIMKYPHLHISGGVEERTAVLNRHVKECNDKIVNLNNDKTSKVDEIEKLQAELNEFISFKNANKGDEKESLEKAIAYFKQQIQSTTCDEDLSNIIPEARINNVDSEVIPELQAAVSDLHPYAGSLMSRQDIDKVKQEINVCTVRQAGLRQTITELEERISQVSTRLNSLKSRGYPPDCMRGCGIRESLSKMISDNESQLTSLQSKRDDAMKELEAMIKEADSLKSSIQAPSLALPIIERIWNAISRESLGEFVLNGRSLITYLNENCSDLPNKIIRLSANSKNYWMRQSYLNDLKLAEGKLETLKSAEKSMLSMEVVTRAIADRELKIEKLANDLVLYQYRIRNLLGDKIQATELIDTIECIDTAVEALTKVINYDKLHKRVEFNEMIISEHMAIRNAINTKLREIETTLNEQQNIHAIVEQEIVPTLTVLEADVVKWEAVEFGVSPTKGLPYIYLVRFINRLLSHVNKYISEVWCYDMELMYLQEDDNLDFSLQVLINKNSIVKDISICSDGQKAIINLAMTLAIAKERGFGKLYPLKLDEVDAALTDEHRTNLVALLSKLVDNGDISQMFLVNHFVLHSGMSHCETVCLSTDGIVVPNVFNEHVQIG